MPKKQYVFDLKPSEAAIFGAAANIYASYVATGKVTSENNSQMIKQAISISIAMARGVDDLIKSDDEMSFVR